MSEAIMFEKNMRLSYLLDFYGEALDDRTRKIMSYYYEDDLSLAEIADGEGISRQGVRHIIKKGEEQLAFLEEKLGLATHRDKLIEFIPSLEEIITLLRDEDKSKYDKSINTLSMVISTIERQ